MLKKDATPLSRAFERGTGDTELSRLAAGYQLCARAEGKSPSTIALVVGAVRYLDEFLTADGLATALEGVGVAELRRFILHLQGRQKFAHHPYTRPQPGHLSPHTINGYLRALRAFWSWAQTEGFLQENPFSRVRIPKAPKKIMPTFTEEQLRQLIAAIELGSPLGHRDYAIILMLLDTGVRCSELAGLRLEDVNLEGRLAKVLGKGSRERLVPIGARLQKALWRYTTFHRPEPATPRYHQFFLTVGGRPLTKDRVEAIVKHYGRKAGLSGVRVSPHTFRHTFAVMFLRNGGDVFSLQRIMGHSTLDVLRIYINMAQADINEAHRHHSPADNLDFKLSQRTSGKPDKKGADAKGRVR